MKQRNYHYHSKNDKHFSGVFLKYKISITLKKSSVSEYYRCQITTVLKDLGETVP
jgi:hypothetical protein